MLARRRPSVITLFHAPPVVRALAIAAATGAAEPTAAQPCTPGWSDGFAGGSFDGLVTSLAVFDEGSGPTLFAAGKFDRAGGIDGIRNIARWTGAGWSSVGEGLNAQVNAIATLNDGSGFALYAVGNFLQSGSLPLSYVARWNGSGWTALPFTGTIGPPTAIAVGDSGTGPAIHIGAGSLNGGVFRWSGTAWVQLGGNFTHSIQQATILTLAVFDDGTGPRLYAGGGFGSNGSTLVRRVARWDGSAWGPVAQGLGDGVPGDQVRMLSVIDTDGNGPLGPRLVAAGTFASAGGAPATGLAAWNGVSWTPVATIPGGTFSSVCTSTISGAPAMYAAGSSTIDANLRTFRLDGNTLTPIGALESSGGLALTEFGTGPSARLVCAGRFYDTAGNVAFRSVAAWDGSGWSSLASADPGNGISGLPQHAAIFDEDGSGPAPACLFVSGFLHDAGGMRTACVVSWDGGGWHKADGGLALGASSAPRLAVFDDGSGPRLYTVGSVRLAGGTSSSLCRWNGSAWVDLQSGLVGSVECVLEHDDGSGPALYVGGSLTAPGLPASSLFRWRNGTWSVVGNAVNGGYVHSLATFDDGTGTAMYATGGFSSIGSTPYAHIARWNGTSWSALGSGLAGGDARRMAVHDDGTGAALFVSGSFSTAGGVSTWGGMAKWRGSWAAVPSCECGAVVSLRSFDDGTGPALYAGADSMAGRYLQRFRNGVWTPIGGAMNRGPHVLIPFSDGTANGQPALYAAGIFTMAGTHSSVGMARWGCAPMACYANCDDSTVTPLLNIADFTCFLTRFASNNPYANCDGSTAVPTLNVADFTCFLTKFAAGCP